MIIEITQTTLKRLGNYRDVVQKKFMEADRRQWRVMTLEVMQDAEIAKDRASQVGAVCAYADYLHRLQTGQRSSLNIYGESQLCQGLSELLNELSIDLRMVSEGNLKRY